MRKRKPIAGRKKWALRVLLVFLAPLLLFAVLEGVLTLARRGHPTDFFVPLSNDGRFYSNPDFGITFFGRDLNRHPGEIRLAKTRPENTFRIFVLGGSAAFGTPDTAFSFARVLEAMLAQQFPDTRFEVVNTGMVAINSHVVYRIARECRRFQPDLFIVYMGNNEVVGPYGPGTALLNFQRSLRMIRAQIALRRTRIAQQIEGFARRDTPREWQGMNMFLEHRVTAFDPRLESVYGNFRANLHDICRVAGSESVPVILSTVVTNLKDLPPFASVHREGLSTSGKSRWEALFNDGAALQREGQFEAACEKFEEAMQIDDAYAGLHFRAGRCLLEMGKEDAAQARLIRARDLDALRFRADSRMNDIIRETAGGLATHGVHLVDAADRVSLEDDAELLYEHVHLTFEGNYALAGAIYPKVVQLLPRSVQERGEAEAPPPSLERCAEWLAFTPHARFTGREKINELTARSPFPEARRAGDRAALDQLRAALTSQALASMASGTQARVEARSEDAHLRIVFGRLQMLRGEYASAAESFRQGLAIYPPGANLRFLLGKSLFGAGQTDEAARELGRVLAQVPNNSQGLQELAKIRHALGDSREALVLLQRALELTPESPGLRVSIGRIYLHTRQPGPATAHYLKAIELDPEWADAHAELGVCLTLLNDHDAAVKSFKQAIRYQPDSADVHYQLALAYARLSNSDAAQIHYDKAAALDSAYRQRPNPAIQ
jgi:tetratricopeptide (TPR) repeat protein